MANRQNQNQNLQQSQNQNLQQGAYSTQNLTTPRVFPGASLQQSKFQEQQPQYQSTASSNGGFTQNALILSLPIISAIILIVVSVNSIDLNNDPVAELGGADRVLKHVFQNLDIQPIIDINVLIAECPENYKPLEIGSFQGINKGCLCSDGSVLDVCDPTRPECIPTIKKEETVLYNWNTIKYCARRTLEANVKRLRTCEASQTKCASDVCAINANECPDNTITVKANQNAVLAGAFNNIANTPQRSNVPISVGSTQFYSFSFDVNSVIALARPIIGLQVSPTATICLDPQLSPALVSTKSYPLFTQSLAGCGKYGTMDPQSTQTLNSIPLATYYLNNDLINTNIQEPIGLLKEPYWADYQDATDTVFLLATKKIEVLAGKAAEDAEYCKNLNTKKLQDAAEFQLWGRNTLQKIFWGILFSCVATIVISVVFYVVMGQEFSNSARTKMAKIYLFSGFILIGLAIAAFMFYFIFYNVHLTNRNHELVELKEKECFGEKGINLAITDFSIFHENTLVLVKFLMWTYISVSVIYLLVWIFVACCSNNEK